MAGSGRREPPLVAPKRAQAHPAKARAGGNAGANAGAGSGAKPARRKPRRKGGSGGAGGGILALPRRFLAFVLRLVGRIFLAFSLVMGLLLGGAVAFTAFSLPEVGALLDGRARGSVTLLDREGAVFAWRGEQFGGQITADTVAPALHDAIIATEDRRFYLHPGVDPIGIASAVRINLREGRGPLSGHGGSTITQQTAKLLCLGRAYAPQDWPSEAAYEADCRRTTLWRKVREAVYALAMEARYTKEEILTIYLNRAYLGAGARGFEAAAQRYFAKSANQVNPAEAAMLAGLLKAPTTYAPTTNLTRARDRANVIIGLMAEQGYLSPAEAAVAQANPAQLSQAAAARAGGYFADWVMAAGPDFLTRSTTEDVVLRTTFDPYMQAAAEAALAHVFETKVRPGSKAEAAIVVMSADGAVRAMVGGRSGDAVGGFNRATMARRQSGSSFKPFVYAAALDLGYSPLSRVVDEPITIHVPGSGPYTPRNYDRSFHGEVTLAEALRDSLNIPAIKVSEAVGRENVRRVAADFGLTSDLALGPALALGASETTLVEMTAAYAGILNGGRAVAPFGIVDLTIRGDDRPLMGQAGGMGERVISQRAAEELTWMMARAIEEGTGRRARLEGRPAAGKTGTTSAARDAWFVGFTADYVAGVWMGYDDNRPLTGVTGSGLPADIWHETMMRVHAGMPPRPLPMRPPEGDSRLLGEGAGGAGASGPGAGALPDGPISRLLRGLFGQGG